MITINIKDGKGSGPKDPYCGNAHDPSIGEIIKYVTEEGDEYFVVASVSPASAAPCHGCVFNRSTGHPLSKIFHGTCDANFIRVLCYDRIYKPIDTILEDL